MFTKMTKLVCVLVLLLAAFWVAPPGVQILLDILICVGALTVATQAVTQPKYIWTGGFVAIAVLFNPIAPLVLSRSMFLWLDVACLLAFLVSIPALQTQPLLSIPSITHRTPGSRSL
ncbi:MAG TPA: DUF6804 family protein [Terriglobia bacterium]|nr:DUF6804 family protein [Terriglobia bacterium]